MQMMIDKMELQNKEIIIRKIINDDAEQVIILNTYVWREAYTGILPEWVFNEREKNIAQRIENFRNRNINQGDSIGFVAELDAKIIGMAFGATVSPYQHYADLGYADLSAIYIYSDYQRAKLGRKLFNVFVEEVKRKEGSMKMVIGVLKENHNARHAYEKWGGTLDSYTQDYVINDVGFPEVFYTYDL